MDPKSIDAKNIADNTKGEMTSMEEFGIDKDDEMYQDYAQMNTAANNVLAAEQKVKAVKELKDIENQLGQIADELDNMDGTEDYYSNFADEYAYLRKKHKDLAGQLDPNSDYYKTDVDKIEDIAQAELKGAQNQLLLQQIIQKDHDNKLNDSF